MYWKNIYIEQELKVPSMPKLVANIYRGLRPIRISFGRLMYMRDSLM